MTRAIRPRPPATIPGRFVPRFLDELDGRIAIAQELNRRYSELKDDVGADTFQKDTLVQRAIFLSVQLETMEVRAVEEGEFDPGKYVMLHNALVNVFKVLGVERYHKKPLDVDLRQYVAGKGEPA
jgi:hypothetical protein